MKYFLGADGGGTKTRAVCIDEKKRIRARFETGASNPYSVGFSKSAELLSEFIDEINEKYKLSGAVLGIAGCSNLNAALKLKKRIKTGFDFQIEIKGDIETAHYGAFAGKEGALVIIGTGSVVFLNTGGEFIKTGGFGKVIGDEGGAFSIARKGFNAVSKIIDGRLKDDALYELAEELDVLQRDKLIEFVNGENIARYAGRFIERARKGSKLCMRILNEEASEVATLINVALKKYPGCKLPVVFTGGLSNDSFYTQLIKSKIKKADRLLFMKPRHTPEYGAALLALKLFKETQ
ncbi:N-acetylglucosamine kinase [Melioribacter sp. Ez-97]|uniref:N-acetylglucosamine kinase n=1 Tax=Melioribacter sp. Ez-97 TaxID=3423434 RepID=UPI003ED8DA15